MSRRNDTEISAIVKELEPDENVDGVCCMGPNELIWKFREYLESKDVSSEVFKNVPSVKQTSESVKYSEIRPKTQLSEIQKLVGGFASSLTDEPDKDIARFWGGALPK